MLKQGLLLQQTTTTTLGGYHRFFCREMDGVFFLFDLGGLFTRFYFMSFHLHAYWQL